MRRKEKQIGDRSDIDDIICSSSVCRLAMSKDGRPYLVPVCFGYDGQCLYIHTAAEGKKIDCFEANNEVCFEFERNVQVKPDESRPCKWSVSFESVIGEGKIIELTDPADKQYGLNRIMRQYSGKEWSFESKALDATRVWKITIASICGKRSV